MRQFLSRLTWKIIKKIGLYEPTLSLQSALERCRFRETKINTVIDIGASNGCWSKLAQNFFPDAFYYLIEANPYHAEALAKIKSEQQKYDYILAAAGDRVGEIYFDGDDPFGGLASHSYSEKTKLKVPVVTVDYVVKEYNLSPPYLLKLDTHGFEIPIFEGADETLSKTNLIIVETYNFEIAPGSLRFNQMCEYLEKKGFRCVDLSEPMFRPKDQALWQFDLFFIPASDKIFQDNTWQ